MRLAAISFVFGARLVQQLAQLPSVQWLVCVSLVALALLRLLFASQYQQPSFLTKYLKILLRGLAALLLGISWASSVAMWRLSDALPHAWEQKTIAIEGVVASVPEVTERGVRFRFDVEKILTEHAVVPSHISLNYYAVNPYAQNQAATETAAAQPNLFSAGERWLLNVRLKRPHGSQNPHGFDFEAWALSENIRATGSIKTKAGLKKLDNFVWHPSYVVEHIRARIQNRIASVLAGKPYIGVIQALVMGNDSQITPEDWQIFLRTGTTHLMSISGLHITMLAGLAFGLVSFCWRRIPQLAIRIPTRKAAVFAGVITAVCYALLAGFSVPTQRTVYMLSVFAVALWSGRQVAIAQVLAIALVVVVVLDPWAVNAPGFWLSFGAVALIAYALGARIGKLHWFRVAVQTQWAVTIGMLPLLLVMFNQASIISPVANAIAIPVISFVVTPFALLGSFLPVDAPLEWSYFALAICMRVLSWLNQLPLATWQQHSPPVWTLFPALLGVVWLLLPRGVPMRWLGLLGFLPMLFILPARPMQGDMKVTVLDVGQGLSAVVQTTKRTLLYDTGPKFNAQSDAGSRVVLPYLRGEGISKLDGMVVSHNDTDHSGGLTSILTLMPVDWLNSALPENTVLPENLETMQCYAGQIWTWDDVQFEVLHPSLGSYEDAQLKDNDRSCVLKITSQAGSMLLTGDIEKNIEQALIEADAEILKSDVIIAPHHGSKSSSTAAFIEAVSPSVSIMTPGYLNRYQHPKPEVMARYQAAGSRIYRSDYHGALEIHFVKNQPIRFDSYRMQHRRYWHDVFEILPAQ
ncbi:MAG TPA: DNA internalization-related competence protein ComEC/Rec2 [Methylophilaceae bacterium]|nr:DNA internalization-related competence protein ComEC/Rec2 [Methylophilaceae bacterium]